MTVAPQHQREAALRREEHLKKLELAQAELDRRGALVDEATKGRALAMGDAYRAGATMTEIGERLGISHSAIHHAMKRAGLEPASLRGDRVGDDSTMAS